MARVTVEDCILKVPNRFELVLLSAQRARDITGGAQLTLDRDNDKNPVVALREIADETIVLDQLQENLIKGMQKRVELDEPEDDQDIELGAQLGAGADITSVAGNESETAPATGGEEAVDEDLQKDVMEVAEDEAVGLNGEDMPDIDGDEKPDESQDKDAN